MSTLLDFMRNSIWHAFTSLTIQDDCFLAQKSRLKVLVEKLGTILDCEGVSLALEDFGNEDTLTFPQFETYLSREVFSCLGDSMSRKELADFEAQIDETCWLLSRDKLLQESYKRKSRVDNEESIFQLFRIYCLLADLIRDDDSENTQVLLCSEEAELVITKFLTSLNKEWDLTEDFECLFSNALFDFQAFLSVIELKLMSHFDTTDICDVIQDIYQEYVDDVVKQGTLLKRAEYFPKFVEKLFILRSSGLTYHGKPKKVKFLPFDADTRVEELPCDSSNTCFHQFYLVTSDRVLHLATLDKRYRTQWISAINFTLSRLHCQESYGRYLKNKRRLEWHRIRIRRQKESERTLELLKIEKMARQAAEDQAKELAEQKAIEEEQRRHLDQVRLTLEKLLAEEIQAKKDEELVRSLQAQILNEEWEKREELERLQEEQRKLLEMERKKSKSYLLRQREMEEKLERAEQRLHELEGARSEMDAELKTARQKNAERNREILETRLRLFSAPIVEDEKIRRTRRSVSMREGKSSVSRRPFNQNLPMLDYDPS